MFIAPAVAGERVFVGSCAGSMMALDVSSGESVWKHDTAADGAAARFHGEMAIVDGLLLIGADARPAAHLYAFDPATGEVRWKHPFSGGVPVDLHLADELVLGVSMDGQPFAFSAATGEPRWIGDQPPPEERGGRPLDPVIAAGRLIVPTRAGVVTAFEVADGKRAWRRELAAAPTTSPVVIGGTVWLGTDDGRLVSLSAAEGTPGRTIASRGFFYGDLVAAGDCLLALRAEGGPDGQGGFAGPHVVACFDPRTGDERWRFDSPSGWETFRPLVVDEAVLVGRDGEVLALSLAQGRPLLRLPVAGLPRGLGLASGRLFVGTMHGAVLAFAWPPG